MAIVSDYTALISGYSWNGMTDPGAPVFVTYSFVENSEVPSLADYQPYTNDGYTAFNAQQRANFILATQEFEQVSGIKFIEVDDPANASIKVMNTSGSPWGGWGSYGSSADWFSSNGYVVVDNLSTTYAPGTYGFEIILHELGHATGLKHPFDGDPTLISSMDNDDYTLMSYTNRILDTALAPLDVDALNYLYGDNSEINPLWAWSWSDASSSFSLTGAAGDDILIAVDAASTIYGLDGDDVLFGRDGDDLLYGGAGDDILGGGSGTNELYGEGGNDRFLVASYNDYNTTYNGGAGIDTLDYSSSTWDRWISLDDGTPGSSIIDIENVVGGSGNDTIQGNAANNVIVAGGGNDTIYGGAGFDWLYGGDGNDLIYAGDGATDVSLGDGGDDTIYGEAGFDYIYGYADNDLLYGGDDVDVIYGGTGVDNLYGEADTDWLFGGTGDDFLYGGANPDLMFGEAGADMIVAGSGNDWIWGGASDGLGDGGADRFVFADGWGGDVIYDFEDGIDRIDLSVASASSFSDVAVGQITGGFTWIAYGSDVIYLWGAGNQNVGVNNISAADFIFV